MLGMNWNDVLVLVRERAERAIRERVFPGCVIGILCREDTRIIPCGRLTYAADAAPVVEDTVYDMASVTKAALTATVIVQLCAEGAVSLDEPVSRYLPEMNNHYGATIRDLLAYRVVGRRLSLLAHRTAQDIMANVFAHGFASAPGECVYTNTPALFLGCVIERVDGMSLEESAARRLWRPLGMKDTTCMPERFDLARVAPTEEASGGLVHGIVHDESARALKHSGVLAGHAGLFSTAPDMLKFLSAVRTGAAIPAPYLAEICSSPISAYTSIVLGWSRPPMRFLGRRAGAGSLGKTGFTGTSIFYDVERSLGLVILSNRTFPKRPETNAAIQALRGDLADIVRGV